jgi:hypothetical protein
VGGELEVPSPSVRCAIATVVVGAAITATVVGGVGPADAKALRCPKPAKITAEQQAALGAQVNALGAQANAPRYVFPVYRCPTVAYR